MSTTSWEKRFLRERRAREEAELLLEQKARDLYRAKKELEEALSSLEEEVRQQTADLRTEIELRNATEQDLIRARDEALKLSHEIRTPLNSIMGYGQLLENAGLSAANQAQVTAIQNSAKVLLEIINDLLDVSKIDSGKMEVTPKPCNIAEVVRQSLELVQPMAEKKGLTINIESPFNLPQQMMLDIRHVRQIITNLVTNAVKYTDSGSVNVQVSVQEHTRSEVVSITSQSLKVAVSDTGHGIAASEFPALFDPYVRLTNGKSTGSGLGLAISKRLAQLLGGNLNVESEVGAGSCFTLEVPCSIASTPAEENDTQNLAADPESYKNLAAKNPLRILSVDDNEVNQAVMEGLLGMFGYQADLAGDGLDAIHGAESGRYDVILMDMRMPHINGREATERIRQMDTINQPYIIAVTASAVAGDKERFLASGLDAYLSKPVDANDLATCLQQAYLTKQMNNPEPAPSSLANQSEAHAKDLEA